MDSTDLLVTLASDLKARANFGRMSAQRARLERGEAPEEGALREVKEELGL